MAFRDMETTNLYTKIISIDNIEQAYYDVIKKFDETTKSSRYSGFDGIFLNDYNFSSRKIIKEVQKDLSEKKPNRPALKFEIPKRGKPGKRNIFVYPVFERVKVQAIYRVLEPYLDTKLTRFLYSYRSSHTHLTAIKQIVRKYNKDTKDYILVGDISSYTENIKHDILMQKVTELGIDDDTVSLVSQFTANEFLEKGKVKKSDIGVLAGSPMSVLFFNLYLNDMDKIIGKKYDFYRRVGDDFIIFDTKEKLQEVREDIEEYLETVKISPDLQKIKIVSKKDDFNFLGYRFKEGIISIPPASMKRIKTKIRSLLRYYPVPVKTKLKRLPKIFYGEGYSLIQIMSQTLELYKLVNNTKQMKELSQYFFIRITIFFYGRYSVKNHRKTKELTKKITLVSFFADYIQIFNGKIGFESMKSRNKKLKRKYG